MGERASVLQVEHPSKSDQRAFMVSRNVESWHTTVEALSRVPLSLKASVCLIWAPSWHMMRALKRRPSFRGPSPVLCTLGTPEGGGGFLRITRLNRSFSATRQYSIARIRFLVAPLSWHEVGRKHSSFQSFSRSLDFAWTPTSHCCSASESLVKESWGFSWSKRM